VGEDIKDKVAENIIEISMGRVEQKKVTVLQNMNVSIASKEFVYLIGKTGSGKSSFLKMLYADLPLIDGEGRVVGFDLKKIKRKEIPMLRRNIGIVFQDFQLLTDRSVMDNLTFVMKATGWKKKVAMEQRGLEVLRMVGIEEKAYKMPHELSGGEQQRVSIARALINNPQLILADEPTGNLDPETSEDIMRLLHAIANEGTATLMATHDKSLIEKFPGRVLKVEKNTITEIKGLANFNPFEVNEF